MVGFTYNFNENAVKGFYPYVPNGQSHKIQVGLYFDLVSGQESSGTITFTLRHEPNKNAAGVSDGDISNADGETDIEATFDVSIQ